MAEQKPRPSESTLLSSTRHMLDELDELMERMLALPVNDLEDETEEAEDSSQAFDEPLGPEPPAPEQGEEVGPEVEAAPSYRTEIDDAVVSPYSNGLPDLSRAVTAEEDEVPSLDDLRSQVPVDAPTYKRPNPFRVLLQPLFWVNRTFDRLTYWMGGAGRWLRSGSGRAVLGYAGVALLVLSLLWLLRGLSGWMR